MSQPRFLADEDDVTTMGPAAQRRVDRGEKMPGLFLVHQYHATRTISEDLVLIWTSSTAEEWEGRIVYLPL